MDNQSSGQQPQIIRPTQPQGEPAPVQPVVSLPSPVETPAATPPTPAAPLAPPAIDPQPQPQPQPVAQPVPEAPVAQPEPIAPPVATPAMVEVPVPADDVSAPVEQEVNENPNFSDPSTSLTEEAASADFNEQEGPEVYWDAPEFIDHHKNFTWYLAYASVALVLVVVGALLTRDVISVLALLVLSISFGIIAARKPRVVSLGLGDKGVYVGNKFYPYRDFNTFSIIREGQMFGIDFMPLKRFAPMVSIYCPSEHEDEVKEFLAHFLPFSQHKRGLIDGLMQRIHF